jgi:hypothetical protein
VGDPCWDQCATHEGCTASHANDHRTSTLLVNNFDLHIRMLVVVKPSDRNTILRALHHAAKT